MIIPMMETTIVCLDSERKATLEELAGLGLLHVKLESMPPLSAQRQSIDQKIAVAENACMVLARFADKVKASASSIDCNPEEVLPKITSQDEILTGCATQLDALTKQRKQLEPWGKFTPETVVSLRQGGINVYFCQGSDKQYQEAVDAGDTVEVINQEKGKYWFVVITSQPVECGKLPLAILPENTSLEQIDRQHAELVGRINAAENELTVLAAALPVLRQYILSLQERLEFQINCEGMGQVSALAYISGFVPQPDLKRLQDAAVKHGWALQFQPADHDDHAVPTLVVIPKAFRIIEPMIKFLGISPSYHETDVSTCILFFLTIFFSMIVGDAGYGALFLVVATVAWFRFSDPKIRQAIKLVIVFSFATIIWGGLCGAWFGIESHTRPAFFKGIEWLTDAKAKDAHIQLICFSLAIGHLTIGRLWRAALRLNSPRWVLTHLGWICILWGNFFVALKLLVMPGPFPMYIPILYITGALLVMIFGIHWHEIGEIFDFPFGVIGSFVDILSYIRLFAVGMSGAYIASSFNGIAAGLFHQSTLLMSILGSLLGIVVLLGGHGINLALAGMGVLVHGVRLNVLEFSNHVGLGWGGHAFKPFQRKVETPPPAVAGVINQEAEKVHSK